MAEGGSLNERFPFAPAGEGNYLLALLGAASAVGSREVNVSAGRNEVSIEYSYHKYSPKLPGELLTNAITSGDWAERSLAQGVCAGLLARAQRVDIESWSGNAGWRWRVTRDGVKEESLTKAPWKDGSSGSRVVVRFKTGLSRDLFGTRAKEGAKALVESLRERAHWAGAKVLVDGSSINQEVNLGQGLLELVLRPDRESGRNLREPKISCQAKVTRKLESSGRYYAKFLFGGEGEEVHLVCRGLAYPIEVPLAEEMGFSGVVVVDHLSTDRELETIIEDSAFDDLINDLESDILIAANGLVESLADLEEEVLEDVLGALELVIETHRASGDTEEAIALLIRLVDTESVPDANRAAYLTQLARMSERQDRAEESFEFYIDALESLGRVEPEDQDLETVATALLGAARLMGIYDDNPETAIDYSRRALELRRSVAGEDDLERGMAAELLGRLYLKHTRYPEPEFVEVEQLLKEALKAFEMTYGHTYSTNANILQNLGEFYRQRGSLEESEKCLLKALAIREKLAGSDAESVGEIFDQLGALFEAEGDITKAGHYYARALEVWRKLVGEEHPDVLHRLNDLVILYRVHGHFDKAEPLYLKLLELKEGGEESPSIDALGDLCSLALFYQVQSKYDQAEPLLEKALKAVEEAYGDTALHPDLAWVHGLLGRFYDEQYRFKKAEEHLGKALKMTEALLPEDHPDLIVCLEALARHYRLQQKYEEAMPWAESALAIAETFYGARHPYLATALNSFGELVSKAGDPKSAKPIYLAAFEIHLKAGSLITNNRAIPEQENSRLASVRLKAEQLHVQAVEPAREYSRFAEAEAFYLRALFLREQVLGTDHFDNARTLQLLADLYRNHRRYEGAESLYRRALQVRQTSLGETHPDCAISLKELTGTLLLQDKREEAEPLLADWLDIIERTLGEKHPERAEVLVRTASILEFRGETERQLELLQEAVTIRHTAFGTENPTFAVTLAEMLRVEEKPGQAAELYDFVMVSLEKNLGTDDPILIPILENYAKVLAATGKTEEAAERETRAMVMRVEHGLDFG